MEHFGELLIGLPSRISYSLGSSLAVGLVDAKRR